MNFMFKKCSKCIEKLFFFGDCFSCTMRKPFFPLLTKLHPQSQKTIRTTKAQGLQRCLRPKKTLLAKFGITTTPKFMHETLASAFVQSEVIHPHLLRLTASQEGLMEIRSNVGRGISLSSRGFCGWHIMSPYMHSTTQNTECLKRKFSISKKLGICTGCPNKFLTLTQQKN